MLDKHILRHLLILKAKKEEISYNFTLYMIPLTVVHVNLLYIFWIGFLNCSLCAHYFTQYKLNRNELNIKQIISLFSHNQFTL